MAGKSKLQRHARARRVARARLAGLLVGAVLVVATVIGPSLVRNGPEDVDVAGDIRPGGRIERLELPALEGNGRVAYSTFAQRPLVINFFASWCPNCIHEMPDFELVHQELKGRVAFLGVSQADSRDASVALARQTGISYPTAIDIDGVFFRAAGGLGMPTTILVRPGGEVADVWVGGLDADALRQLIADELGVA
jgi:thiol-disulfide isomerase/thioredoxin